jgi:hypothetical protein
MDGIRTGTGRLFFPGGFGGYRAKGRPDAGLAGLQIKIYIYLRNPYLLADSGRREFSSLDKLVNGVFFYPQLFGDIFRGEQIQPHVLFFRIDLIDL